MPIKKRGPKPVVAEPVTAELSSGDAAIGPRPGRATRGRKKTEPLLYHSVSLILKHPLY